MEQMVRVKRTFDNGTALVIHVRESACSGDCHKCGGCGGIEQILQLTAKDPIGVQKGDAVYVEADSAVVLKGAFLLYLLPLVLFLAGYLAALRLGAWAFAVGCGGFLLGLLPAVLYDRYMKKHPPEYVIVGYVK